MHYYKFNIADYRKDTAHLSRLEHGIYRDLIDWYFLDEKPIPLETQSVMRRLRLDTDEEATALQNVLNDFFVLSDGYRHKRIDKEIADYYAMAEKNRENGKQGGRPKKTQSVPSGLPDETQTKGNHKPLTINHKPVKENKRTTSRFDAQAHLVSLGVDSCVVDDWLAIRKAKRLPATKTAIDAIEQEIAKAGLPVEKALRECCNRGWGGFKASWLTDNSQQKMTQHQLNQQGIARSLGLIPKENSLSFFEGEACELAD